MRKHVLYWLAVGLIVIIGCQKETSFETGGSPAEGSLQSDASGDCLPKTVSGVYIASTALVSTSNTITVSVIVTKTGTWDIGTDTVNGYYFRGTGTFTTLGPTNIVLRGNGTPFASGVNNFVVSYGTSICDIQVTVLPAGSGPAVFTLVGSGTPPNCTTPIIAGAYALATPLNASNTVTLNVNVTTAGSYNVTTTAVNGMTFSGSGALAVGNQTIVLTGSGTPTTAGANTIPVTAGSSTCNFVITVSGTAAVFTLNGAPGACGTPTIAGTYTTGTALTAANTVTLNVNVTTAGAWSVTTAPAVNGMVFSGSGNFAATGPATIVLTGTGTPTNPGATNIPVTAGSSTCTFTITVGGSAAAVFTLNGAPGACGTPTIAGTYTAGTALTAGNTVTLNVNVTTAGSWNVTTAPAVNGMTFAGSGNFASTGPATIVLTGAGTPGTAGSTPIPVTAGSSTCTFTITVAGGGGSAYTPNCASAVVDGLYEVGTQLNASNTVDITVNVTATGPYNISTTATNGMTFTASGTFSATGSTVITLVGSGTPAAAGTFNIPMPGTTPCTFPITVDAAPTIDWQFTVTNPAPNIIYRGQTDASSMQPGPSPGSVIFGLAGSNSLGTDDFQMAILDLDGSINVGDTYVVTASSAFTYTFATGDGPYEADPSITGVTFNVTITVHNTATHLIQGTFSGVAKKSTGETITFTTGSFKAVYP